MKTFEQWWETHGSEFDSRVKTVFADLWRQATKAERERCIEAMKVAVRYHYGYSGEVIATEMSRTAD